MKSNNKEMVFGLGSKVVISSPQQLGEEGFYMNSAAVEAFWGEGAGRIYDEARMARWNMIRGIQPDSIGK